MHSFRVRIFVSLLAVALLALGIVVLYGERQLQACQMAEARERLLYEARLVGYILQKLGPDASRMEDLAQNLDMGGSRLSLMDAAGNVLADTARQAQPVRELDNHADRPEVRTAASQGQGFAIRRSGTLDETTAYAAIRLADGHLLRLSVPLTSLEERITLSLAALSDIALLALGVSLLLAALLTGTLRRSLDRMVRVIEGISLGDYQRRLRRIPGKEFAPLAEAVNRMAGNIEKHIRLLADQSAQLESILDSMNDGVLLLDSRGGICRCNRAFARNFPATANRIGANVVEVIPSPVLQQAVDAMLAKKAASLPEKSASSPARRLELRLASGQIVDVCLAPQGGDASRAGLVAVFRDISELVRLERIRHDFVANVSHELRTPLTAIQGYAETLLSLECGPECRRFAHIILKNGTYLASMVDDLLVLARLENQTEHLALRPCNPAAALHQAVEMCRGPLQARNVRLAVSIPENLRVMASPSHLAQLFRNLLENACRYAPEGGEIRVTASPCGEDALFRVVDDGPGIPSADLERVFERFYQVEKHRSQGSSGLGLAICKHLVEQHGGRIRAESPACDGSTAFVFNLRMAAPDGAQG